MSHRPSWLVSRFPILVIALTAILLTGCGSVGWGGPVSDHFDGERFHNAESDIPHGLWAVMKWRIERTPAAWPAYIASEPGPPPPSRVGADSLRYTFINHATVLIQTGGLNILTDPIWSDRASPVGWAGPQRVRAAGVAFDQLSPIDLVLVSHNHADHMDLPTLKRLYERDRPVILTGLGNAAFLADEGIPTALAMDWWDTVGVGGVNIHFVPSRHGSRRGAHDGNKTLWGGFVIASAFGRVYFAGDTGYTAAFKTIAARLGPIDLAFLPIGCYQPGWIMSQNHLSPSEALGAHLDLNARASVAMHFGTFQLSDEAIGAPAADLKAALEAHGVPASDFVVPEFGVGVNVPAAKAVGD